MKPDIDTGWRQICMPTSVDLAAAMAGSLGIAPTRTQPERIYPSMFERFTARLRNHRQGPSHPIGCSGLLDELEHPAARRRDRLLQAIERPLRRTRFPAISAASPDHEVTAAARLTGANAEAPVR